MDTPANSQLFRLAAHGQPLATRPKSSLGRQSNLQMEFIA